MGEESRLQKLISEVGEINEGDVIFSGGAIRKTSKLDKFIINFSDAVFSDFPSSIEAAPEEETFNAYIKVDANGRVLYNSMENPGVLSSFLRKCGLISPKKDWHAGIKYFKYDSAVRFKNGELIKVNGNLCNFNLDYKQNTITDLDCRPVSEFLKIGDYGYKGKIILG